MDTARDTTHYTFYGGGIDSIVSRILLHSQDSLVLVIIHNGTDSPFNAAFITTARPFENIINDIRKMGESSAPSSMLSIDIPTITSSMRILYGYFESRLISCNADESYLISRILKKIKRLRDKPNGNALTYLYVSMLFQYVWEITYESMLYKSREEVITYAFNQMLASYAFPKHQVGYYADKLFITRRYLTRAVRNCAGETPKKLIDLQIISKAKELLASDASLLSISEILEFESASSFASFFKKKTGLSPSLYRKSIPKN